MRSLVVIPARGGSKGLPGKNIKLLNNKPLIQYTIEAAREVFDDSSIYVSTDSQQIKEIVESIGLVVPFIRPFNLSTDSANSQDVLMHALKYYREVNNEDPEIVIMLQPTSPMRKATHIREALKLYRDDIDMVVSVKETKSNPYYVLFEENNNGFLQKSKEGAFTRRQDCPKVWEYNGAIYIINIKSINRYSIGKFKKVVKYQMDEIASHDIDTKLDFDFCKMLLEKK